MSLRSEFSDAIAKTATSRSTDQGIDLVRSLLCAADHLRESCLSFVFTANALAVPILKNMSTRFQPPVVASITVDHQARRNLVDEQGTKNRWAG